MPGLFLAGLSVPAPAIGSIFALGTRRLHPPDLDSWVTGQQGAYRSPPLLARLRKS
ncbi:hypothetical protein [Streptomyces mayteni]